MDNLAQQLKRDADRIDVEISEQLEHRIAASLRDVRSTRRRPAWFWWASSLTGVAAALLVIAVLNEAPVPATRPSHTPRPSPGIVAATPAIDWKAESAMLTSPLRKELDDLQSDLKKAEEKVREDIGL